MTLKKLKLAIGSGLIAALTFGSNVQTETVKICAAKCATFTHKMYVQLKKDVVARARSGQPIDATEWQLFTAILNTEIKRAGGLQLKAIHNDQELRQALIKFVDESK